MSGTSFILTFYNQENSAEYFLKMFIYKFLYYNLNVYELILVDLGSTDSTMKILNNFANDFSFIKVMTLEDYKLLLNEIKK